MVEKVRPDEYKLVPRIKVENFLTPLWLCTKSFCKRIKAWKQLRIDFKSFFVLLAKFRSPDTWDKENKKKREKEQQAEKKRESGRGTRKR